MRSKNFDGHSAIEAGITRAGNFSHAACTQQRLDFIRAEFRARSESHPESRNYSLNEQFEDSTGLTRCLSGDSRRLGSPVKRSANRLLRQYLS